MAKGHAHRIVLDTAKQMAGELYEDMMRDNDLYARWKELCPDLTPERLQAMFLQLMTPSLLKSARATLAQMLTTNISDELKSTITEALILDHSLSQGRTVH